MKQKILDFLHSPSRRTRFESLACGGLILAGLAARYLFNAAAVHNALMTAAAVIAGADIAVRAWNSLRNRHISIELLVAIAAAGALAIGEYWEAAAVTFLFIFGAYLEARTLGRTRKVLGELLDLAPVTALVLRDGQTVEVTPEFVLVNEIVLVKPGMRIPVDGEVTSGASAVDESSITGEPIPEEKTTGAQVFAGTVNLEGMLQVRATGVGADTTLARIIARVEEAQEEKAPTQRFIERFSRWYTPTIIILSLTAFALTRNLDLSLTLLVIGCPGALVISTPVSIIAGIGQAARRGILIKGGEYLENAGRISAVALDKTGTITFGKPHVTEVIVLEREPAATGIAYGAPHLNIPGTNRWNAGQKEILYLAGTVESASEHPLALAIEREARAANGELDFPESFETFTGKGIQGTSAGRIIRVGSETWLREQSVAVPEDVDPILAGLRADGKTAILVAVDRQAVGILGISDPIRETAVEMIGGLKRSGIRKVVMLTGDDEKTARAIARQAGIEHIQSNLLPEGKLDAIRRLQAEGHTVAMVGDGINDTPALAAADIGIAMGAAGTGIAIETADIALMADDLLKVPEAIRISRATLRNIHQNVAVALVTVSALLAGVLVGEVHMAGGMLVHQVSVLVVILNGMRLLK